MSIDRLKLATLLLDFEEHTSSDNQTKKLQHSSKCQQLQHKMPFHFTDLFTLQIFSTAKSVESQQQSFPLADSPEKAVKFMSQIESTFDEAVKKSFNPLYPLIAFVLVYYTAQQR